MTISAAIYVAHRQLVLGSSAAAPGSFRTEPKDQLAVATCGDIVSQVTELWHVNQQNVAPGYAGYAAGNYHTFACETCHLITCWTP